MSEAKTSAAASSRAVVLTAASLIAAIMEAARDCGCALSGEVSFTWGTPESRPEETGKQVG